MNTIDLILGAFLLWGIVQGFRNGLIIEAASIAALILGIWGAIHFSDLTATFLVDQFHLSTRYLFVIAFAITFVAIVVLVHFLARALDKLVKAIALGWINRLAGMVFGLLKMAFIISVILVIINSIDRQKSIISKEKTDESWLYQPLLDFAPTLFPFLNHPLNKKGNSGDEGEPVSV